MPYEQVTPIIDRTVRTLCPKRYPGHPRGCPNYGKRPTCPPAAPMLWDILDPCYSVWCVWNVFDFASHVERMRARHPAWSSRQLANCLYWQGTARKALRREVSARQEQHPIIGARVVPCPEACGVDVTATMKTLDIDLEWPPRTVAYQVALVGVPCQEDERGG